MNLPVMVTILLGGLAVLDATPVAQTMLSQPLVTATLLGMLWGDLGTALEVGVVLQILAVSTQPVGARTPEDYAAGGVVGAGAALALAAHAPYSLVREASAMLGVTAGITTAIGGAALLRWQRRLNEGLSRWCESELLAGRERALDSAHLSSVVLSFGIGVSYTALCLAVVVVGLGRLVESESLRLAKAWSLAQPLWLGLGLSSMLQAFVQRQLVRGAVFGAALIGAWIVLVVGSP